MGLFHYLWSRTAASNQMADSNVNWQEGQAPSSVNDSARAMMASLAGYRDDIAGAIVTTGTSTAYAVTSYQIFDTLAHMSGQLIAFTPHATNGATVTLNVDGLGAKPLRSAPGVELPAGVLILGSPYVALFNNSDSVWYLQNFYVNPYTVPLGGIIPYLGTTAPNSAFVLPYGQAISRTTYATLFTLISTTFGVGDGSTTFNVPDIRGRFIAGKDDMGGSAASRLTTAGGGLDGATLGAVKNTQSATLTSAQIPSLTSSGSNTITVTPPSGRYVITSGTNAIYDLANSGGSGLRMGDNSSDQTQASFSGSNSISVTYTNGAQTAVPTVPTAIVLNQILRVI